MIANAPKNSENFRNVQPLDRDRNFGVISPVSYWCNLILILEKLLFL